eukprot:scaffold170635_cov28-Tisochrysis_lutea.AAC.1
MTSRMLPMLKVSAAVTVSPRPAATAREAEVTRTIESLNAPASSPEDDAAATSDVVAGERKLKAFATTLKMLMPTPTPASCTALQQRPMKAVSTREATGSIASPTSAGAPTPTISRRMAARVALAFAAASHARTLAEATCRRRPRDNRGRRRPSGGVGSKSAPVGTAVQSNSNAERWNPRGLAIPFPCLAPPYSALTAAVGRPQRAGRKLSLSRFRRSFPLSSPIVRVLTLLTTDYILVRLSSLLLYFTAYGCLLSTVRGPLLYKSTVHRRPSHCPLSAVHRPLSAARSLLPSLSPFWRRRVRERKRASERARQIIAP